MRITDQYVWNVVFLLLFTAFVVAGIVALEEYAYRPVYSAGTFDLVLIALASFRMIRLFVHDAITAFFREQFWDQDEIGRLVKPARGPRRTIADLLSCVWCFGIWSAATVAFFYFLTPYAYFPVLFLAMAGVATFLQLMSSLVGWKVEELKQRVESK